MTTRKQPHERGAAARFGVALAALVAMAALATVPPHDSAQAARVGSTAASAAGAAAKPALALAAQAPWVTPGRLSEISVLVRHAPRNATVKVTLHDNISPRSLFLGSQRGRSITNALNTPSQTIRVTKAQPVGDGAVTVKGVIGLTPESKPIANEPTYAHPHCLGCRPGIYPVEFQLQRPSGATVSRLVTYLILLPTTDQAQFGPLDVALVLPLETAPLIAPDGSRHLPAGERARLHRLLNGASRARQPVPLTLLPSPQLLEPSINLDPALRARLVDVAARTSPPVQVLAGPYVQVDESALAATAPLQGLLNEEINGGRSIVNSFVVRSPIDSSTWAASSLDAASLGVLRSAGITRVLVPDRSLPDTNDLDTNVFSFADDPTGQVLGLTVDHHVQDELGSHDSLLGAQRALADLVLAAETASGAGKGVALVPPPDWNPTSQALDHLLDALAEPAAAGTRAALSTATVQQLFQSATGTDATRPQARQLTGGARSATAFSQRLAPVQQRLAAYRSTVTPPTGQSLRPAANRKVTQLADLVRASGYRGLTESKRDRYLDAVANAVNTGLGGIDVPTRQTVTLTSRSGNLPFTVRNNTGVPVRVQVALDSTGRVAVSPANQTVSVPGENARVNIRVTTRTSGDTPVHVRVLTGDGSTVISESQVTVRSTAVSGVGLILTIGAGLFLVVWWLRHWRKARARRAGPPGTAV